MRRSVTVWVPRLIHLSELASRLGAEAEWLDAGGALDRRVSNLALPANATLNSLSFNHKPENSLATNAAAVLTTDRQGTVSNSLVVDDLLLSLARVHHWLPVQRRGQDQATHAPKSALLQCEALAKNQGRIHRTAIIEGNVYIGHETYIGPYASITGDVRIGSFCRIDAHVNINGPSDIANRVSIGAHTTIGEDPFLYIKEFKQWLRVPDFCGVTIGDDVDIGGMCTIDRGLVDDTHIGGGVKLDNHVHVGHGARLGDNSIVAARTNIAGEAIVGENCCIGGGTSINEGVLVGDDITLLGMSAVTRSLTERGEYTSAWPVQRRNVWWRQLARLKKLARRT